MHFPEKKLYKINYLKILIHRSKMIVSNAPKKYYVFSIATKIINLKREYYIFLHRLKTHNKCSHLTIFKENNQKKISFLIKDEGRKKEEFCD